MKQFLSLDSFRDEHLSPPWQQSGQQSGQEALAAATDAERRQCAAMLQPGKEAFNSGSCRGKVKDIEASRTCGMSNQPPGTLQQEPLASRYPVAQTFPLQPIPGPSVLNDVSGDDSRSEGENIG